MRASGFQSPGYSISIAIFIALIGVSLGLTQAANRPGRAAAASDPVIAAAGDIACDPAADGFNDGEGNPTSC